MTEGSHVQPSNGESGPPVIKPSIMDLSSITNSTPQMRGNNFIVTMASTFLSIGLAIVIGNLIILLIIARDRKLHRKEFLIPAGLALGDLIYGGFYVVAPIRRFYLLSMHAARMSASSWDCLIGEPYNILHFFGSQMMASMLVAVSVDRCIAMFDVFRYMSLRRSYTFKMVAAPTCLAVITSFFGVVSSYRGRNNAIYHRICFPMYAVSRRYLSYHTIHILVSSYVSTAIYMAAMVFMMRHKNTLASNEVRRKYQRRQEHVTKMLLYVSCFTLLSFSVPNTFLVLITSGSLRSAPEGTIPILRILSLLNSANNLVIYLFKNQEIRKGFYKLRNCHNAFNPTRNNWFIDRNGDNTSNNLGEQTCLDSINHTQMVAIQVSCVENICPVETDTFL